MVPLIILVALSAPLIYTSTAAFPPKLQWVGTPAGEQSWPRALPPKSIGPISIINQSTPGSEGNLHGLEGGKVVAVNGDFHVFTAATFGLPYGLAMRLEHWISHDRIHWTRRPTLSNSTSAAAGRCKKGDPRSAIWEPIPVYDTQDQRWLIYYTAYMCRGDSPSGTGNSSWAYNGSIFMMASTTKGYDAGIEGPWEEQGLAFHGGDHLNYLGTDSFHPYGPAADGRYYALVGLAIPATGYSRGKGCVGLATAPSMHGPWVWKSKELPGESPWWYVENPVVVPLPGGGWVAMMDNVRNGSEAGSEAGGMAVIYSRDGMAWDPTLYQVLLPAGCRTPLGMVPLPNAAHDSTHRFAVFYTHTYDHRPFCYCNGPKCGGDVGKCEGWEALFTGDLSLSFDRHPARLHESRAEISV